MADTYTTQGRRGTHTRNTVFDNTDPWDYRHYGSQPAPQNNARQAQQNNVNPNPAPQQRNQNSPNAPQARQQAAQGNNQPQQNSQPMSVEDLIRRTVAEARNSTVAAYNEGEQYNFLVGELTDILHELEALQKQAPNSTESQHAAAVQENISALIDTVNAILTTMRSHQHDQGADLVRLNRVVETQLVNLVHGFQDQIGILGVVIFDSVNDSQNNFAVTSSEVRNVDYRRFGANPIISGNNQAHVRIGETWVRPEGVGNAGLPNAWSVYLPAETNMNANVLSAVLTCPLRRSIADMWRGYGQSGVTRHASYWGEVRHEVAINVRFCIPLDDQGFANAIDNAYAQNSTDVPYNFTSSVDPRTAAANLNHTHTITIGGNALQVLYANIRNAIRRNSTLAQLYRNLAA